MKINCNIGDSLQAQIVFCFFVPLKPETTGRNLTWVLTQLLTPSDDSVQSVRANDTTSFIMKLFSSISVRAIMYFFSALHPVLIN